jgi:hypothetical protein
LQVDKKLITQIIDEIDLMSTERIFNEHHYQDDDAH